MTRRRLIPAACVAVVAIGAAWWWSDDGLKPEEQQLAGRWRNSIRRLGFAQMLDLKLDHSVAWTINGGPNRPFAFSGIWSVKAGKFTVDCEPNRIRRWLRPILGELGMNGPPMHIDFDKSDFAVGGSTAGNPMWTRDGAD